MPVRGEHCSYMGYTSSHGPRALVRLSSMYSETAGDRRTNVTVVGQRVGGATTQFLYDRANLVQEISGTTANLLAGLGIDEVFARTDSSGARHFLTDALGSTLALLDPAGAFQTQYTYEPFGKVTVSGPSSGNPFQYTGRENDGTGLYYYRARYYSPTYQRFASEDPIGFAAGMNFYGYVANSPVVLTDPSGLDPRCGCLAVPEYPPGVDLKLNIARAHKSMWLILAAPRLFWFYMQVRNRGPWDYKQIKTLNDFGALSPSPFEQFGNFNYGATGAAAGLPLQVLLRGAGWAQQRARTSDPRWGRWYGSAPYGDDPRDQEQITAGYNYYENRCYE